MEDKYLPAKESIECLILVFTVIKDVQDAKEDDGIINWKDTFKFTNLLKVGPAALNDIALVKLELQDETKRALIIEYFDKDFDLIDDVTEEKIEAVVQWLEYTYQLAHKLFLKI